MKFTKEWTFNQCIQVMEEARDKIKEFERAARESGMDNPAGVTFKFVKNIDSFITGMREVFGVKE